MLELFSRREASKAFSAAMAGGLGILASPVGAALAAPAGNATTGRFPPKIANIRGAKIAYRRTGSGPAILLLHGWPEFSLTWEPVMERLAQRFDVIAPDLRGFGDSDKPDNLFSSGEHAEDMSALLAFLDVKQAGVVSHDVGGAVAQAMAASTPESISALMFFGFIHPGVGERFYSIDRLHLIWYMFFHEMPFAPALVGANRETVAKYFGYFLKEWPYRKEAFDTVFAAFIDNFCKPGNIEGGFAYYRTAIPPRTNPPVGKAPPPSPAISLPTAVRWPEHDALFPVEWMDRLPDFFTDLDAQIFPGVGHFPHREDPDHAAAEIASFFGRHLRA